MSVIAMGKLEALSTWDKMFIEEDTNLQKISPRDTDINQRSIYLFCSIKWMMSDDKAFNMWFEGTREKYQLANKHNSNTIWDWWLIKLAMDDIQT